MATMLDPGGCFIAGLGRDQLEALVETMYLVAFSDGSYGAAERSHFARSVEMLTEGRVAGPEFEHVVTRMVARMQAEGRDGCVASLKQRLPTPELRQVALILAVDMAAADGVLDPRERRFIEGLGRAFDMNARATREVLDGPLEA
jgi:tellurite resistance protein